MCVVEVHDEIKDEREWILIVYGVIVDAMVVLHRAKLPVLLGDEEKGGCILRFRGTNVPFLQLFREELL